MNTQIETARTLFTALVALCYVGSPAQAQEFTPMYVEAEKNDEDARACQVSNVSIVAVVESELRHNRIPVGTRAQVLAKKALYLHVNTTALPTLEGCAVAYNLALSNLQGGAHLRLCEKGGLMTGAAYGLQSRLNAEFRDFASQCISQYLK